MKCGFEHKECTEDCKHFNTCARKTNTEDNQIKTDCIFYWPEKHDCKALKCLYCFTEKCKFYKSSKEYHADGTKKNKH